MPVTRRDRDEGSPEEPPVAWHNQTSTLLGASVAGIAAIAVLIGLISYVAGEFTEPERAPLYYAPPTASTSATTSGTATSSTTGTITSTSPPMTSDINGDTTTSSTTTTSPSTRPPRTREPSTTAENEDGEPETTRNRPRTNVTRTLYPGT